MLLWRTVLITKLVVVTLSTEQYVMINFHSSTLYWENIRTINNGNDDNTGALKSIFKQTMTKGF